MKLKVKTFPLAFSQLTPALCAPAITWIRVFISFRFPLPTEAFCGDKLQTFESTCAGLLVMVRGRNKKLEFISCEDSFLYLFYFVLKAVRGYLSLVLHLDRNPLPSGNTGWRMGMGREECGFLSFLKIPCGFKLRVPGESSCGEKVAVWSFGVRLG